MMKADPNCKICNGLGHISLGKDNQGKYTFQICNCYRNIEVHESRIKGYCPRCENTGRFTIYDHSGFSLNNYECDCNEWSNFQTLIIKSYND